MQIADFGPGEIDAKIISLGKIAEFKSKIPNLQSKMLALDT